MKSSLLLAALACSALAAETIDVPAGKTEVLPATRTFAAGPLVKTGTGTLDVSAVLLPKEGIDVQDGAVRLAAGGARPVRARHVRFTPSASRPAPGAPPTYGGQGWQISEFRLTLAGKPVAYPKGTSANACGNEGGDKAIDGKSNTKCFRGYKYGLELDFGEEVTFDGYTFDTANDAIGRDPRDWTFEVGMAFCGNIGWAMVDEVKGFVAPEKRFAPCGKTFGVKLVDVVPPGVPVHVGPRGRLVLVGATELFEKLSGAGVIELDGAEVTIAPGADFHGAIVGKGCVHGW